MPVKPTSGAVRDEGATNDSTVEGPDFLVGKHIVDCRDDELYSTLQRPGFQGQLILWDAIGRSSHEATAMTWL